VFVASSMFQAMGNTVPSLVSSGIRIVAVVVPTLFLVQQPGFELWSLWVIAAGSIFLQMAVSLLLLQREFRRRLAFGPAPGVAEETVVLPTPEIEV